MTQPATILDAAAALDAGRTTSRALVEHCLARIADPAGEGARAFVAVYGQSARTMADAMDRLRIAGRAPGPFAGVPVSLKDLLDVAGETTRAASVVLAGAPPATVHATVVQRVLAAGLVPVGRTNMTEFAFSGVGLNPHFGNPRSPYRRDADVSVGRISGGSSSGAAVSVADGMALAALGTDTGGSCRIPAALCGVVGFKPTARRVPREGVLPLSPTLDSVGPLANTVACCAIVDAILAGAPHGPRQARPAAGLRLLAPTNLVLDGMDAPTERAMDRAIARLDRAGVIIHHARLGAFDLVAEANARGSFAVVESYAWHRALLAGHAARYDPRVASRIAPGANMAASDYVALAADRARAMARFAADLAPFDAMLMPTVPVVPPPIAAFQDEAAYGQLNYKLLRNAALINFVDGCAISLPCHESGSPPAGLTLAAPAMADGGLLAVAESIEMLLR